MYRMQAPLRSFRKREVMKHLKLGFSKSIVHSPYNYDRIKKFRGGMSLPEFLFEKVSLDKNVLSRTALLDGSNGESLSYEDLFNVTYSCAQYFRKIGIQKGDCIAIVSPNTSLTGAHSTTVSPYYTEKEMESQFEITKPKVIIAHPSVIEKVLKVVNTDTLIISIASQVILPESILSDKYNIKSISEVISIPSREIDHKSFKVDPESILTIPFSSGTTGKSKGVVLTHNNVIMNCLQGYEVEFQQATTYNNGGTLLTPLPFFHIYGMVVCMTAPLQLGTKVIFTPGFDMPQFLSLIQEHRVDRAIAVPPIILALYKSPIVSQYDTSSLKAIMSGAAPLGKEVQEGCAKRLGCIVKQGWGMTELSPVGTTTTDSDVRYGSSGRLVAGSEAKIVDPASGVELDPTQEGELLFRGPQVMRGYHENAEATTNALLPDGFLRTGDIGKFDEDGYLYITDRCKELIKYKGLQVPPAELEAIIASMEEVSDVVVIPVLDDEAGEIPRAYVVKKKDSSLSEQNIIDFVHSHVSAHKRLRGGVRFTDVIPKSASGKLLRRVQIEIDRKGGVI